MINKNNVGSSAEAQKIFDIILKRKRINNFIYDDKEVGANVKLSFFNSNDTLLPSWMLRSDEIAVMMTGKRLWNVIYQGSSTAMMGYTTVPINNDIPKSYLSYDVASAEDIPFSLKVLICQLALTQRIKVNDNKFNIENDVGFYFSNNGGIQDGKLIEFPNIDHSLAFEWNKISHEFNKQYKVIEPSKDNNNEFEEFSVKLGE